MYDLIILGGGPAGCAAAVYAARKKMKTLLLTENFGGQSVVSDSVENWIGTVRLSGMELAKRLEEHVRAQEDIEVHVAEKGITVKKQDSGFVVETEKNAYEGLTVIVATGGRRRRLGIPGEDAFDGKGVVFCSTCDAPLFKNKVVAVVGGGNAGLEAVVDLLPYASQIFLLVRGAQVKGDPSTMAEIQKSSKVTILQNALIEEIIGDKVVTGIKYTESSVNVLKVLPVQGVFIEIGSLPNSECVKGVTRINAGGEIEIDHKTSATSEPGIFAAGDVTDEMYKQNNISVGDAVKATLSAYNYLLRLKRFKNL